MHRPGNSIAVRVSLSVLVFAGILTACGGQGSGPRDNVVSITDESGMLRMGARRRSSKGR
jgi:hypothetical protein